MSAFILAGGKWLLGSWAGRIILGVLAFLIWLHFHDGRLEARVRGEIVAEQAKLALQRIETLEKNNADFNSLPDRERCLVFMRDSGLPESHCSEP